MAASFEVQTSTFTGHMDLPPAAKYPESHRVSKDRSRGCGENGDSGRHLTAWQKTVLCDTLDDVFHTERGLEHTVTCL